MVANGSVPYSSENFYSFFTTLDGHVYAMVTGLSNTISFYDIADLSNPVFVNSLFFDLYTDDNSSPTIGKVVVVVVVVVVLFLLLLLSLLGDLALTNC